MADPLDPVYSAALSADMAQGLALLEAIPASSLDAKQRAEGELLAALNRILAAAHPDLDVATAAAKAAIASEGLHALTGMTLPLHELMIWKRNAPTTYHLALPEQDIAVTVVSLDDCVSLAGPRSPRRSARTPADGPPRRRSTPCAARTTSTASRFA